MLLCPQTDAARMANRVDPHLFSQKYERRHDKTNKVTERPAKTQISLGIRPVRSESSLALSG